MSKYSLNKKEKTIMESLFKTGHSVEEIATLVKKTEKVVEKYVGGLTKPSKSSKTDNAINEEIKKLKNVIRALKDKTPKKTDVEEAGYVIRTKDGNKRGTVTSTPEAGSKNDEFIKEMRKTVSRDGKKALFIMKKDEPTH